MARFRTPALLFVLLFLGATVYRAAVKPLWYDEFFTYYVAGQGGPAKIWTAIRAGIDPNPPLFYAAMYVSQSLLGDGHVGTRLPSILGFLVFLISIYRFTAFRLPAPYAAIAMVFASFTGAYSFATEARAYALLLGFTGLALVCWQRANFPGVAAALSAAILTHCYSVLVLPPLFVGELVRTRLVRKIHWPAWLSLALPCLLLLTYPPLLETIGKVQVRGPIFDPTVEKLLVTYLALILPAIVPAVAVLLVSRMLRAPTRDEGPSFSPDEWSALAVFALAPAAALTVALIMGGGYFLRYCLSAAIPISVSMAWLCHRIAGPDARAARLLPALSMAWFAGAFLWQLREPAPAMPPAELAAWKAEGSSPLVVTDGQTFLELDHYLDPDSARRLVFLTDRDAALRYMQTDCYDGALRIVKPWFPIRGQLVPYRDFMARQEPFLAYGTTRPEHVWMLPKLRDDGIAYSVVQQGRDKHLIRVSAKGGTRNETASR